MRVHWIASPLTVNTLVNKTKTTIWIFPLGILLFLNCMQFPRIYIICMYSLHFFSLLSFPLFYVWLSYCYTTDLLLLWIFFFWEIRIYTKTPYQVNSPTTNITTKAENLSRKILNKILLMKNSQQGNVIFECLLSSFPLVS